MAQGASSEVRLVRARCVRAAAVLLVATSVSVAHAEPARSRLVGGVGLSRGLFVAGSDYYDPDTLHGTVPSAYVGWRVRRDLAISVDAWVFNADDTNSWADLWGGAAGVRADLTRRVQVAARLGYSRLSWNANDGHTDEGAVAVGLDVSVALIRDRFGAVVARGTLTAHPAWEEDHVDAPTVFALGLGLER